MKRLVFMLIVGAAALAVLAVEPFELDYTSEVTFSITDVGDTAMVTKYRPAAFDSFLYVDSFSYQADTTAHQTISWRSPVQTMIITPTVDVATTYSCSLDFNAGATVGVEKDYAAGVATLAALIDTLVDLINGKAVLTDSVTAEDSVTYIKLVSNFSGDQFAGRWSMIMVVAGGAGTLDSAAHASQATVAMICDTMVALINADVGLDSFVTAVDEDTVYTVTADQKGMLFFGAVFGGTAASPPTADSLQDTVHVQANVVTSSTTDSGTVVLTGGLGYGVIKGKAALTYADAATWGMGVDSCILHLYSGGAFGVRNLVVVETCAATPCTLGWTLAGDYADSIVDSDLQLWWWIIDTTSDTNLDVSFNLHRHLFMEP